MAAVHSIVEMLVMTEECRTPHEVVATFEKLLRVYGFRYYAIARHARPDSHGQLDFMASRVPEGWLQNYAACRHATVDPALRYLALTHLPFRWRQAMKAFSDDPNLRHMERMIADAAMFGLKDGYSFPIHGKGGLLSFVSLGGDPVDLSPTEVSLFQAGAKAAYWKLRAFDEEKEHPDKVVELANPVLTRRELDVLVHLADGLTSNEISELMSISRHTVDWYMTAIQSKLGARNRQHAVAIALRNALIP